MGKIFCKITKDVITFQGKSVEEIETAFHDSIDVYLDFCKDLNKKPVKPFLGKFIVRVSPSIHYKIYIKAIQSGESLNKWINETLKSSLTPSVKDS